MPLLLLFRYNARSSIAQEERMATSRVALVISGALNKRFYPLTENGGHSWRLSSSLSLTVGIAIQDKAIDVARSAPQGAHCHADVIYLLT